MADPRSHSGDAFDFDLAVARFIDGSIDPATLESLNDALRADAALRLAFTRRCAVIAELHERHSAESAPVTPAPERTASSGRTHHLRITLSIAAALVLTAAAVAVYVFAFTTNPRSQAPNRSAAPIATLIETSGGGTVIANDDVANPGDTYPAGEYSIESGAAEFLLASRVTVEIAGDTRVRMHTPMSTSVLRGRATFNCPPGSEGFTVHLPSGARVVDLGTRFTVIVNDDGTGTVFVGEGKVEVRGESDVVFDRLVAGQAVRVGPAGQMERLDGHAVSALGLRPPNSEMFEVFTNGLAGTARATATDRGVDLAVHSTDTGGSFLAGHFVSREPIGDRDDAVRVTWRLRGVESVNRFGLGVQNYRGFNWAPGSFSIVLTAPGSAMSDQKPGTFRMVVGTDTGGQNIVEPTPYDTAALDGDLTVTLEIDPHRWTITCPQLAIDVTGSTRDSAELTSLLEGPLYATCFVHARGQTPAVLRVLDMHTHARSTSTDRQITPSAAEAADPPRSVTPVGRPVEGENLTPDSE